MREIFLTLNLTKVIFIWDMEIFICKYEKINGDQFDRKNIQAEKEKD